MTTIYLLQWTASFLCLYTVIDCDKRDRLRTKKLSVSLLCAGCSGFAAKLCTQIEHVCTILYPAKFFLDPTCNFGAKGLQKLRRNLPHGVFWPIHPTFIIQNTQNFKHLYWHKLNKFHRWATKFANFAFFLYYLALKPPNMDLSKWNLAQLSYIRSRPLCQISQ